MQSNKNVRYFVLITDKYRAEEPRYLWYCGTKKYRKGDGTGTVEKWYRGAAVVPWYRATLISGVFRNLKRGCRPGGTFLVYIFKGVQMFTNLSIFYHIQN